MRSPPTCSDVQKSEGPVERLDCSQLPAPCPDVQKSQGPVEALDCSHLATAQLRSMFPDQKNLLAKLSMWRIRSASALLERLQYQGPVELLTMHLCLILNTSVFRQGPLDTRAAGQAGAAQPTCSRSKTFSTQQFQGMGCSSSWRPQLTICGRVWLLGGQSHVMSRLSAAAACLPVHHQWPPLHSQAFENTRATMACIHLQLSSAASCSRLPDVNMSEPLQGSCLGNR